MAEVLKVAHTHLCMDLLSDPVDSFGKVLKNQCWWRINRNVWQILSGSHQDTPHADTHCTGNVVVNVLKEEKGK